MLELDVSRAGHHVQHGLQLLGHLALHAGVVCTLIIATLLVLLLVLLLLGVPPPAAQLVEDEAEGDDARDQDRWHDRLEVPCDRHQGEVVLPGPRVKITFELAITY